MKPSFEYFAEFVSNYFTLGAEHNDYSVPETMWNSKVEVKDVDKLQEKYVGLVITPKDRNVGVSINLSNIYSNIEKIENWKDWNNIFKEIKEIYNRGYEQMGAIDAMGNKAMNWNYVKEHLFVWLVPAYQNATILSNCPHFKAFDLALVYRIDLGVDENDQVANVLVTYDLMEHWGATKETLHEVALKSASKIRPATFMSINEVMYKMTGDPSFLLPDMDLPMRVASVEGGQYGAAVIFYDNFLKQIANKWDSNLIILPSSIHECLILPDDGDMELKIFEDMVEEVNIKEVEPEDKLSDNVYYYDRNTNCFSEAKGHLK